MMMNDDVDDRLKMMIQNLNRTDMRDTLPWRPCVYVGLFDVCEAWPRRFVGLYHVVGIFGDIVTCIVPRWQPLK